MPAANHIVVIGLAPDSNTPPSAVSSDGKPVPLNRLSTFEIGVCYSITDLKSYAEKNGIQLPEKLIDQKSETSRLLNGKKPLFKSSIVQVLSTFNIAGISRNHRSDWLAEDLLQLWRKISDQIDLEEAISRGNHCQHCAEMNARGIPLDIPSVSDLAPEYRQYQQALSKYSHNNRVYSPTIPFATTTGRNSSSSLHYPLGLPKLLRRWIVAPEGRSLIYLDYRGCEFGIAAALSNDPKMHELYVSGEAYSYFQRTLNSHIPLHVAKRVMLALQFGVGIDGLAKTNPHHSYLMSKAWHLHRKLFPTYWEWTEQLIDEALLLEHLRIPDGWQVAVTDSISIPKLINWPIQATGAYLLRACVQQFEASGINCIGMQHDSFLLEVPKQSTELIATQVRQVMEETSGKVLRQLSLKVSCSSTPPLNSLITEEGEK